MKNEEKNQRVWREIKFFILHFSFFI